MFRKNLDTFFHFEIYEKILKYMKRGNNKNFEIYKKISKYTKSGQQ